MEEVVATVEKNRREEIRIALREYEGRDLCDVRVFAEPYAGDEWIATKKGISMVVAKLPALIAALQRAEAVARANGLIEDQGEAA